MADDSEPCITLYDTASRTGKPWNPMGSRARFALNFKKIPFKTIYLEYPAIEPTLRAINASPTHFPNPSSKQWFYTIPVIVDPFHLTPAGEPTIISDSFSIAEYLDKHYPTPNSLFPPGTKALQKLFDEQFTKNVLRAALPTWLSTFPDFLNDESRPYFRRTREKVYNKTLEEICPRGTGEWHETWDHIRKAFSDFAALLDKNTPGTAFVMDDSNNPNRAAVTITYADLITATVLETIRLVTPHEWEEQVKKWDGGRWGLLQAKCRVWSGME